MLEHLYVGRAATVYRARARRSGASVVLKMPKPGARNLARLRHEYTILKDLDLPGVIRARGLEEQGSEVALVLDDLGGETLAARLARGPVQLPEALSIAVELADTLGQIHQRCIMHKDINPHSLLLDTGGHVRVFDFDIATRLPREIQSLRTPNQFVGTLHYISPEQTGWMNRAIDYRTDLYSFGVTLYEMLTGRVPFSARDPMEIIYSHITKIPTPPVEALPSIPTVVSLIVMKLLEKRPEARYKSAFGLKVDLEECRRRLAQHGSIESFPLGQADVSDRFQIPEKLYGREEEIAALSGAFARVAPGTPELLLVTGSSGIGKSSVIHELYRSLSPSRGYFVSGKFEELKRDIPYSALLEALSELIRSVLSEPDEQFTVFRQRIEAAVRGAGSVLTSVLPELTHILGAEHLPELSVPEAEHRFRFLVERFLHVFTRHGQPLVLFLDDLQWADAATLDLLTSLLSDREAGALLVIGAYRDNDVSACHPLLSCITEIEKEGSRVTRVALGPIDALHVRQLLTDTLSLAPGEAWPLAELLWRRTSGNPLFVGEFLTMLCKNGLVEFDPVRLRWSFDLAQIERVQSTETVAELMAARASLLSARAEEALQFAALLGSRFDLTTLASVAQRSPDEAAAALEEALREGLLLSLGQGPRAIYRFFHDWVQEAVYVSIPEDAKARVHHRIGQLLLQSRPRETHEEWPFEVLHHLNLSAEQVSDPERRIELARLNQKAAERASASGAFAAAAHHAAAGIRFLPDGAWTSHHELMFILHLGLSEGEFLSGNHGAAEQSFARLREEARTDIEQLQVYELFSNYERRTGKYAEALHTALEALALVGIKMGPTPRVPLILLDFLKTKLALRGRSPAELLCRSETTDPRMRMAYRLLALAAALAFSVNPTLHVRLALKLTRMVVEHGNSPSSALGYSQYAMILAKFGEYSPADAFGRLAIELTERYPNKRVEAHVKGIYGSVVQFWRNPLRESHRYLEEAYQVGLLSGELTIAGIALTNMMQWTALSGSVLDAVLETCQKNRHLCRRIKDDTTEKAIQMHGQAALALQGRTLGLGSFDTEDFDEARYVTEVTALGVKIHLYRYLACKVRVLYILERHEEGLSISKGMRRDAQQVIGFLPDFVDYRVDDALLLASLAGSKGALVRQHDVLVMRGHLSKLKKWAENAPMNFRHKYLLVAAELSRVTDDDHLAIGQYEEAIKLARENEFLQDEAISLELAGKFYRSRGLPDVAVSYLARARRAYTRWGAHAKVALLDQAYPGLSARAGHQECAAPQPISTTSSTSTTSTFDIPSMVKASQALSGEIALDKLLLRLMNIVTENAGAERGALVIEQQGALLVVAEFTMREGARLPERPVPITASEGLSPAIVSYVMRTQKSVLESDASREGAFATDAFVTRNKSKAVLSTPLVHKGEAKGALYLENNLAPGAFTPERAELVRVLCAQMAISIENARLYADLDQKVKERTRALQQAEARLIKLEKDATETQMAGGFAHEMRNALAGAKNMLFKVYRRRDADRAWSMCLENSGRMRDLAVRVRGEVSERMLEEVSAILEEINEDEELVDTVLEGVGRSLDRGLGITRLILDYAELGRARAGSEVVSVQALVGRVMGELEEDFAAHRITVEVEIPAPCTFTGDELHLHAIVMNLVVNARDALLEVEDESRRAIRVQVVDEPLRQVLMVSDTGSGIPAELHEKIFEPFFTTKLHTGTGLGMGVVRKLASLYGGVVEIESARGRGTTFRVILPK
jgi:predicted ATPase/signal transduction histidine kinase